MTKIVLCSRHPITIAGFQAVIQTSGDFSLSVCRDTDLLGGLMKDKGVHVALIDVAGGLTLEKLSDLRSAAPEVAIVLWVDGVSTEFISQAIALGVMGVLRHDAEAETCFRCLRHAAAGDIWVENDLSIKLLRVRSVSLTPRERQLAGLLAQGLRNKEIAHRLGITEGTVKVYLSRLYGKVGASDRLEFALFALNNLAINQVTASGSHSRSAAATGTPLFMPTFVSAVPTTGRIQ